MNVYDKIFERYRFSLPNDYRVMARAGWFHRHRLSNLWVPEAEWLTPKEILKFEFESYCKPGFVPFACTAAGDHWCWWPAEHESAVVLCPHDSIEAYFDAPSFVGSIYRRILDYCLDFESEEEKQISTKLLGWRVFFAPYFLPEWLETLTWLRRAKAEFWRRKEMSGYGLLSIAQHDDLIKRHLQFPRLNERFEWMNSD